jgi:pyruvate, orthophosphate dikinase
VSEDTELAADDLRALVAAFKALVREEPPAPLPGDPHEQLWGAIEAVFDSWDTPRARGLPPRQRHPDDLGTAVNVMAMVFGNMGDDSGTGVAFTRDPSTGEPGSLRRVPGERAGRGRGGRHPRPAPDRRDGRGLPGGVRAAGGGGRALERTTARCRTWSSPSSAGTLYMLQTRTGKRSAARGAHRRGDGGRGADHRGGGGAAGRARAARPAPAPDDRPDAPSGGARHRLPASPGAASGRSCSTPTRRRSAAPRGRAGDPGAPRDLAGGLRGDGRGAGDPHLPRRDDVARGGGRARDGQVLRRRRGEIQIDEAYGRFSVGDQGRRQGDWITLDGSTGAVILGQGADRWSRSSASTSSG